jgi:hypothetical protein
MMQSLMTRPQFRAGVAASLSSAGTLFVAFAGLLLVGIGWQWLYSTQVGIDLATRQQAMRDSLASVPASLWGWLWAPAGVLLVGILCALLTSLHLPLTTAWLRHIPPAIVLGMTGGGVVGWLYTMRAQQRDGLPVSDAALLVIGAPVALLSTSIFWMLWSWWYQRWMQWLRRPSSPSPAMRHTLSSAAPQRVAPSPTSIRRLLLVFTACTLLIACSVGVYRTTLMYASLWDTALPALFCAISIGVGLSVWLVAAYLLTVEALRRWVWTEEV